MRPLSSPYIRQRRSTAQIMAWVIYATLPAASVMAWFFGPGVWLNLALASLTSVCSEALVLYLRQKPIRVVLTDNSALLTGILLALALPTSAPWWLIVLGVSFAIIVGKQLYGGLGLNPMNPAMLGYVFLLVSFPVAMTNWLPPQDVACYPVSWADAWSIVWHGHNQAWIPVSELRQTLDTMSSASPLDGIKIGLSQKRTLTELVNAYGWNPLTGSSWALINLAFLAGGLVLVYLRIVAWAIPASFLLGLGLSSGLFFMLDPDRYLSPLLQFFSGATMFGAFFIATDPVTAATTPKGRWLYGFLMGVLVYGIRTWGAYPDAVAFAVLLLNIAVPSLDYYTQPRVYGQAKRSANQPEDRDG